MKTKLNQALTKSDPYKKTGRKKKKIKSKENSFK